MTRLLLIRHAESVWNAERRWQGRADPPLSVTGRRDAKRASAALQGLVDAVYASPQLRARETAALLTGGIDIHVDDDLREIDIGEFTGLTTDEVNERYADELAAYRSGEADSVPGGETRGAMFQRVMAALDRIAASPHERVLVVTHGGAISTLERHFDIHPGEGAGNLSGRWFEHDGVLRPDPERVHLIRDEHEAAPEAR